MHACNDFPIHGWKRYVMAMWATDAMLEGLSFLFLQWIISVLRSCSLCSFECTCIAWSFSTTICMHVYWFNMLAQNPIENIHVNAHWIYLHAFMHVHTSCPSRSVGPWCTWCSTATFRRQGSSMHASHHITCKPLPGHDCNCGDLI